MTPHENQLACAREMEVVGSSRSGVWTEELRGHLSGCESCADALLVAEFLRQADAVEQPVSVPAAGLVWWKAQLRTRREVEEKAARPVVWAERAALVAGSAIAFAALARVGMASPLVAAALAAGLAFTAIAGGAVLLFALRRK